MHYLIKRWSILMRFARVFTSMFLIGLGVLGCGENVSIKSPPLRIPFSLIDSNAYLETQFEVVEFRGYSVGFDFHFDEKISGRRESIRKQITKGDPNGLSGSVNVQIEISNANNATNDLDWVRNFSTYRITSWGKSNFNVELEKIRLRPGIYKLVIRNKSAIRDLQFTTTNFIMVSDPKSTPIAD